MRLQGIFFDVDGTLLGLEPEPEVFYRQVCREQGLACDQALPRARAVAVRFVQEHGLEYLGDERGMWRAANRGVFAFLGAGKRAGDCAARFQELFRAGARHFLHPDVLPALHGLHERGYLMGALTGRLHSSEGLLADLGVRPYFSFYLYAGELGVLKPDPRMYRAALERAGLPAAAVVLVGDDLADVQGARSAGLTPLLIARGRERPAGVAHLADLRELLPWLERPAAGGESPR